MSPVQAVNAEDFAFEDAPGFRLRGRQPEWVEAIEHDFLTHNRLLVVAPGGVGKTGVIGAMAKRFWERGQRTLITENREHLTEQTAQRVRDETGLEVDVEMASQRASPFAPVVVASVQSLGRLNRLTSFADNHFGLVVPDECHLCLAEQPMRILNYFHYGAESLAEGWVKPAGLYVPKSKVAGFTASPDIGERRSLGEFFERTSVNYSYLSAIEEGWLVGIREMNLPIRIDTRKFRRRMTTEGADFNIGDQSAALIPIIKELAEQIVTHAKSRKTICFLPSVECSRLMADALNGMGMRAIFVSGECLDKSDKIDEYNAAGAGTVLVNCAMVVYGVDFPDTDCIAVFSAVISRANYVQKIYRGTRVLPGLVSDDMTVEQRLAVIAASKKPHLLVLSPFFISDRIDICEAFNLFGERPEGSGRKGASPDLTKPAEIRDFIKALERAADKHAHKQARTIDPVRFGLSLGDASLANYTPETQADAAPAAKAELDFLLEKGLDTTQVRNSGHAQKLIARFMERERLGLATPKMLMQLLLLGFPEDNAVLIKKGLAGVIVGKRIRYKKPCQNTIDTFPA